MTQDKINRINELAHKENLTDEEKAEQAALRDEYRKSVISNLKSQLDNVKIVDEEAVEEELEKKKRLTSDIMLRPCGGAFFFRKELPK